MKQIAQMEKSIEKFKFEGKVACWKFIENSKNYPGWNICFDDAGRASLLELLEKINKSEWPSKKQFKLCHPLDLNQGWIENVGEYQVAEDVILSHRKSSLEWALKSDKSKLKITFGIHKLKELKEGFEKEIFDEAVPGENDSDILYFW
jgi:hypothetical protein